MYRTVIPKFSLRLNTFVETVVSTFRSSGFLLYPVISSILSTRHFGLSSLLRPQSSHHNSRTHGGLTHSGSHFFCEDGTVGKSEVWEWQRTCLQCMSGKTCRMAPLTVYDGPDIDPFCTNCNIVVGSCTDGEWVFVVFIFRNWCVCVCV